MNRVEAIRHRITQHLNPEQVEIMDDSDLHRGHAGAAGGGGHYRVRVVSSRFANRSLLERHRMVYQAVGDMMPGQIHALSIQALTPDEQ